MTKRKERRLIVGKHRYGEGKTHRMIYSTEHKRWWVPCRGVYMDLPHGEVVNEAVITCKRCEQFGAGYDALRMEQEGLE